MTTITWIPVAERLPDADTTVLVWTQAGEWYAAFYDDADKRWRDAGSAHLMLAGYRPTHWADPVGPFAELPR